jgi:hypothetical protein
MGFRVVELSGVTDSLPLPSELARYCNAGRRHDHSVTHQLSIRPLGARSSEALRIELDALAGNGQTRPLRSQTAAGQTATHSDQSEPDRR